ncbi:MAG: nitrite reductase small subunit NirD [Acidimicrobiia bacterium]
MTAGGTQVWVDVCAFDDLVPDRGVCALVDGEQVAIFRVSPTDDLYALSNYDPFSGVHVLSRGIVGSKGDIPKVASPIYKQNFDLRTGTCLDKPEVSVPAWAIRRRHARVEVARP